MQILHYFYLLKTTVSKQIEAPGTTKASHITKEAQTWIFPKHKKKLPDPIEYIVSIYCEKWVGAQVVSIYQRNWPIYPYTAMQGSKSWIEVRKICSKS